MKTAKKRSTPPVVYAQDHKFDFHRAPGHLIRRAQQIAVALFVEETSGADITPIQFALMSELARHPEIDQATLASQIAVDVATFGQVAIRLEERGLIERATDPIDRRRKRLVLTTHGKKTLAAIVEKVESAQTRIMAPLTQTEAAKFIALLTKLVGGNNDASRAPLVRYVDHCGRNGNGRNKFVN
jgi:MarR family transcriptional regulator, temperature-dependent positive regulator of motility